MFINIDVHSSFSINRNSIVKLDEVFDVAKNYGMPALGITEVGSTYSLVDAINLGEKYGVKPLISVVFPITTNEIKYHVRIYPKNSEGVKELWLCNNHANLSKNGLSNEVLATFKNIMIVIDLEDAFKNDKKDRIAEMIKTWATQNEVYIGLKYGSRQSVKEMNTFVRGVTNVKKVILTDVTRIKEEQFEAQQLWVEITQSADDSEKETYFENVYGVEQQFSKEEINSNREFAEKIELSLTKEIHSKGKDLFPKFKVSNNLVIPKSLWSMLDVDPEYVKPTDEEELRRISYMVGQAYEGLFEKFDGSPLFEVAFQRLKMEMGQIVQKNDYDMFLSVGDFCDFVRREDIPRGDGRGSAAGVLLAYCLGITNVNPIPHGLYFERFSNRYRTDKADIDLDFSAILKHKVYQYAKEKYGDKCVAKTMTHSSYGWNDAVRDIGKRFEIAKYKWRKLEKGYNKETKTLDPKVRNAISDYPELKKVVVIALDLIHLPRSTSFHASAVIITEEAIVNNFPVVFRKDGENGLIYGIQINDNDKQLEKMGLSKIDFLSLHTVDVKDKVMKTVGVNYIPMNDELTMREFQKGNTVATFQLDSVGARNAIREVKPNNLDEVALAISINRPGAISYLSYVARKKNRGKEIETDMKYIAEHPLLIDVLQPTEGKLLSINQVKKVVSIWTACSIEDATQWINKGGVAEMVVDLEKGSELAISRMKTWFYFKSKEQGRDEGESKKVYEMLRFYSKYDVIRENQEIKEVLKETYGVPVYQEQIMKLVQVWANYNLSEADVMRRVISKKKSEEMQNQQQNFIKKSVEAGRDERESNMLFDMIKRFANYGFNKSHAVAYALQGYKMMYLKAHYPQIFMSETVNMIEKDKKDKIKIYLEDMEKYGLKKPDINTSSRNFIVEGESIEFGLRLVKYVGNLEIEAIEMERNKGKFTSLKNAYLRLKGMVRKEAFISLIKSGAFDAFGERVQMLEFIENPGELDVVLEELSFGMLQGYKNDVLTFTVPQMEYRQMEKESKFASNILDPVEVNKDVIDYLSWLHMDKKFGRIMRVKEYQTKKKEQMAFTTIDVEKDWLNVSVFQDVLAKNNLNKWQVGLCVIKENRKGNVLQEWKAIDGACILHVNKEVYESCSEFKEGNDVWYLLYVDGYYKSVTSSDYERVRMMASKERKIRFN
ncbi:PHP domain-containing protein [Bacillus bombysepticus]|uniref:helix-hairpin-helix domain-containing protein n=1 Tax=Bacillus bombysepticus TaxID=658666 RepID=UPI0030182BC7